jgi:peptidyl-prolyl cis-trans isomerase SurA
MSAMFRWSVCLVLCSAPAMAAPAAANDWQTVERIVAIVNDDLVLARELDRRVAQVTLEVERIPDPTERTRRLTDLREAVLQALIDDFLISQAAARVGLAVTPEEVDRAIELIKAQNNLDDAALARALADTGMTMPEYRAELHRELLRMRTIQTIVGGRVQISDARLRAAYDAEKQQNPALGDLAGESERIRGRLHQQDLAHEADKWIVALRRAAHVEVRP